MTRRVGQYDIVIDGKKGWTVHWPSGSIVEIDFDKKIAEAVCYLGFDSDDCSAQYGVAGKKDNLIYLYPFYQSTYPLRMAIFDIEKRELTFSNIPRDDYSVDYPSYAKCYSGGVYGEIFVTGKVFPGILKVNDSADVFTIGDSCLNELIEMSGRNGSWHFFADGMASNGNYVYFASGMSPSVLKIDCHDNSSELIKIPTDINGFAQILKIDEEKCLLIGYGEHSNRFLVWNFTLNEIVCDNVLSDYYGGTEFAIMSMLYNKSVLLFPVFFPSYTNEKYMIYKYDWKNNSIERLDVLDSWKKSMNSLGIYRGLATASVGLIKDKAFFVTGVDLCWHVIDKNFNLVEEFTINVDDDENYNMAIKNRIEDCRANNSPVKEADVALSQFCKMI